jgi:tRNA threonylcarbamoyladenosine biosynthesis protein TsaE
MVFAVQLEDLNRFANDFWDYVRDARVFAFHGEMGAGKTTIIEALCKAKGVDDVMGSPTFSIINEYAYEEGGSKKTIYHMDLYRLKDEQEIIQAGVEDCLYSGEICFVEWPQKATALFDKSVVQARIDTVSETGRSINIELPSHSIKEQS